MRGCCRMRGMKEDAALGLLIDRTYDEVAAAAADPRRLDRRRLVGWFSLWDNHLIPAMASGGDLTAARKVWWSLGCAAGPDHHALMASHLDGLGLDPGKLLGPGWNPTGPTPDYAGHLRPKPTPVDPATGALIAADYDFDGGTVNRAWAELSGADRPRLDAFLQLTARRRRYTDRMPTGGDEPRGRPNLTFTDENAELLTFPGISAQLTTPPRVEPTRVAGQHQATGPAGPGFVLAGPSIEYWPEDVFWYESAAARAAEPDLTKPWRDRLSTSGMDQELMNLAVVQKQIMIWLRTMRYPALIRRMDLAAAGQLCAGLGSETMAIAARPLFRNCRAGRRLARLVQEGAPFLHRVGHNCLKLPEPPAPPRPEPITQTLVDGLDFADGRLRYVSCTQLADEVVLHLDARHRAEARDTIAVVVLAGVTAWSPLTATADTLTVTGHPTVDATTGVTLTIPLAATKWTVTANSATWYTD